MPLAGLFVYRITIVMHDCTHATLFRSRRVNKAVGSVLGAATGIDFHSFATQHARHHQAYGVAGDPQGFHYLGLRSMTRPMFGWHLLKPLLGLNLRYTIGESVLAPRNLARHVASGEIILVALVQLALLALVTGLGRHPALALLPLASAATFGLFFSQLRGIAEHGAVGADAEAGNVRTHAPHWLDRVFLYDLHFNYHAEHHAHPQIPSCRLAEVIRAEGRPVVAHSMFRTLSGLRPHG